MFTKYKGLVYPNVGVARWAIFLDNLGVKWEARFKKSSDLPPLTAFWVETWGKFVIGCGDEEFSRELVARASLFALEQGKTVLLLNGFPWPKNYGTTIITVRDSGLAIPKIEEHEILAFGSGVDTGSIYLALMEYHPVPQRWSVQPFALELDWIESATGGIGMEIPEDRRVSREVIAGGEKVFVALSPREQRRKQDRVTNAYLVVQETYPADAVIEIVL